MSFVPKGWSVKTFGEVLSLITNGINGKQNKEGNGIPVSRIETIADQRVDLSRVGFLAEYDEGKIDKYRLEEGDILFSHINSPIHLGKTALVSADIVLYHGANLLRLKCEKSVDPRFFNYYCKYLRALGEFSKNAQHAVNQSSINQKKLKAFELVAPSLEEQKRIADKLDSVLAKVEAAQARLDKIPAILKRFRQSVLAAATSGELTRGYSDASWETTTLGAVLASGPQNGIYKPAKLYGKGTKIIRIDGFYNGQIVQWDTIKRVEIESFELAKWKLNLNDILINRVNSIDYLGKCGHVKSLPEDAVFESNIMRVSLKDDVLPEYLTYFLSSPKGLARLRENAKHAVNQASINQNDVKSVVFEKPSIREQQKIVSKVDELFEHANAVEKQFLSAKVRLDKLSQSVLKKAFQGELLTNSVDSVIEAIENSVEALNA